MRIDHKLKIAQLTADDFDKAIFMLRSDPSEPVFIGTVPKGYTIYLPTRITPDCDVLIGFAAPNDKAPNPS